MEPQNNQMPMRSESSRSSWIVGVIVLLVLLAGGLYFWSNRGVDIENDTRLENVEDRNNSDEVLDIEADIEATDTDNVDYDLDEGNFNAS